MDLQVHDRVVILDAQGNKLAEGTIVSINDFREPSLKYAVDVDGYIDDLMFFGESQLVKIEG